MKIEIEKEELIFKNNILELENTFKKICDVIKLKN